MSKAPAWIEKRALLLLHQESLLDSAPSRPINKHNFDACKNLAVLAAAYGFGIVRNHPFVDGNKRAAFLAVGVIGTDKGKMVAHTLYINIAAHEDLALRAGMEGLLR